MLAKHHILKGRQVGHQTNVLKGAGNANADSSGQWQLCNVLSESDDAPLVTRIDPGDQIKKCGLASTVGTNQRGTTAPRHVKADPVDHRQAAKRFAHIRHAQGILHGLPLPELAGFAGPLRRSTSVRVMTPWGRSIMSKTTAIPKIM